MLSLPCGCSYGRPARIGLVRAHGEYDRNNHGVRDNGTHGVYDRGVGNYALPH